MRIDRLHLIRYGPYTDRTINFDPGAALHLVYGPNEAGKSSALGAIADLLFGFPNPRSLEARRQRVDFRHPGPKLRLGATLRRHCGETIDVRRRRSDKASLLEDRDDDVALNDDALAPWLGGLTREVFTASFGLNSERLRAGADDLLNADGEVGAIVMAAASGLSGLAGVRAALEAEAGELYTRRATTKTFNAPEARHKAAVQAERAAELRAAAWHDLNAAIDSARETLDDTRRRRQAVVAEAKRIEALRTLRGVVAEIDAGTEALTAYADLGPVQAGLAEPLAAHLAALTAADRAAAEAAQTVEEATRDVERIVVDAAMVSRAGEVRAMLSEGGAYKAALEALPGAAAELREDEARIADRARRLGTPEAMLAQRQPTEATLARATDVADALRALEARRQRTAEALQAAREESARLEEDTPAAGPLDPRQPRADLTALAARLEALKGRHKIAAALRRAERDVAAALASLDPAPDLDAPAIGALPPVERLAEQAEALREIERDGRARRERLREVEQHHARLMREIAEAEAGAPLPTAEALAAARRARDAAIGVLGEAATGTQPLNRAAAEDAVAIATRLTGEADALADQAFAEVERVTTHAKRRAEAAGLADEIARREADLADLRAQRAATLEAWRAPFTALGLEPGRPDEMPEWRRRLDQILDDRAEAASLADELAVLAEAEASTRAALEAIAQSLALPPADLPTDALAIRLDEALKAREADWLERQKSEHLRRHHAQEIARRTEEATTLAAEADALAVRLAAVAAELGLAAEASLAEVEATVALWRELPDLIARRDAAERRRAALVDTKAAFEARIAGLAGELAPDLAASPALIACEALAERAAKAQADATRQEAATERKRAAEAARDARRAERDTLRREADAAFAGLPGGKDRARFVARLAERDRLAGDLAQCRRRFAEIAPGADEAHIRDQLAGLDPATDAARLDELARDADRLGDEENVAYANLREREQERDERAAGLGAEAAAFEKHAAAAEMQAIARDWAVRRIASHLLSAAIERQRQRHHGPLVERAGALFATITNGAFDGLAQRFDDNDRLQLVARRGEEELDPSTALSDGSRDQLYLALRLALVEDYATRNEPSPFIGDDIFQTFDDARTAAGLAALADIGATVQPILFAHHRSVVDIARERLGNRVDIIMLGD